MERAKLGMRRRQRLLTAGRATAKAGMTAATAAATAAATKRAGRRTTGSRAAMASRVMKEALSMT
eukprot:3131811-Pleurochrysis_carterae.AAC.1